MSVEVEISFGPFPLSPSRTRKGRIDRADFSFSTLKTSEAAEYPATVKFYCGVDAADVARATTPAFETTLDELRANNGVCYPSISGGAGIIDVETSFGLDAVTSPIHIEGILLTLSDAGINNTAWSEPIASP